MKMLNTREFNVGDGMEENARLKNTVIYGQIK